MWLLRHARVGVHRPSDGCTNGAFARTAKTHRCAVSRTAGGVLASTGRPQATVGAARTEARTSRPEDEVLSLAQIAHPLDSWCVHFGRLGTLKGGRQTPEKRIIARGQCDCLAQIVVEPR